MNLMGVVWAAVIVGGTGLFLGVFLELSGKKFAVEVGEREEAISEELPGNNCGGCGFPGCSGLAAAIASGEAGVDACPVGGRSVAEKIAEIMGKSVSEQAREVAFVKCCGTSDKAKQDYEYFGIKDCTMMNFMQNNGPKGCNYGCHGFGNCVRACPFDAIQIITGVAVVDKDACKACKKCIAACPRSLIELVPEGQVHLVQCNSKDRGKDVMAVCTVGCIGCKMCAKVCESNAVHVEDNIAYIDPEKCTNCGGCAEKCPKKCISQCVFERNDTHEQKI